MTYPITRAPETPWTAEQIELMESLRAQGLTWPEVAPHCGHTAMSCCTKMSVLRRQRRDPSWTQKPKNTHALRPWTDDDTAKLIELHETEVRPFPECDKILERTYGMCRQKYLSLRRPRIELHGAFREPGCRVEVPQRVLAERDERRRLAHQTITAARMGDPLPGRSALDKMKGSVA